MSSMMVSTSPPDPSPPRRTPSPSSLDSDYSFPWGSRFPQQPQIILLKEGTDTSQGRGQMLSNISACTAVADTVRTTLGPRGMDKLIHDDKGTTISNDGATIMRLLDIIHPAAKVLVDIAKSQDSEVPFRHLDAA
jgi:hypothetical protein